MEKNRRLTDSYKFPGIRPNQKVKGKFGDQKSLVITMKRVQKKLFVRSASKLQKVFMTGKPDWYGIYAAEIDAFISR
jgi:hypothetical protein